MIKRMIIFMLAMALVVAVSGVTSASVITNVVRSNGVDGDRDPIGPYDGSTVPLATEAGGLRNGNMVFSDRTYPWAGIPEEYAGTEYVRTFNSDKNGGTVDVTYEVTTGEPAIVWITVDDRIPADWDADGTIASQQDAVDLTTAAIGPAGTFYDSGLDIYVREKDDGSRDRPMSVFVAELPAGTYVFGSMDSGKNFYTIGAIGSVTPPEPAPEPAPEPEPEPEPEPVPPLDISNGVKINFQQTGGDVPEGYLPDGGEIFADRGNGISYGWNMDSTGGARDRNNDNAPDERYDTTNHLEKGEHRIWEIELPNGVYSLLVACGDVNHSDQINNMDVEGVVLLDPDGEDNFDEYVVAVAVNDGLLTIQMAAGASNAKIMFVDIAPIDFLPGDIAISTQAGWFGQGAADREMQEIVDNVTGVSVEQFTANDQVCLVGWVVTHTGDGVADLLILCGQFPDLLYPGGNAQPDGSLAELFLDDGNIIINTGDYLFYVNNAGANNGEGGIREMMDIPGITMWDDDTSVAMTAEGHAVAPSLQDLATDRPFHLNELEGDWVPELILAQNAAGTRADPVIVVNTVTGGRLGIFYQTNGQDDDPRGEVISEWINNWYLTGGGIPNSTAWRLLPEDGAVPVGIDDDLSWLAGIGAASHEVYIGTEIPPAFAGNVGAGAADVTGPGDVVQGVPNDGDWPGAETPDLAIDDNTGTKYLHFKGETEPTGIQITPAAGVSIVSGLTFTTANDATERDPISFELSGSNDSIDGPYELIASGDIVDFAQADASPRFTMNATAIEFDNDVAYAHYQIMFPAVRDPGSANSMQIAEIELIGVTERASFDPGVLEYGTTYFWQVDEIGEDGTVLPGAVQSFTTTTPVGIFEYSQDIGNPAGIGRTTYEGYVWKNDQLSEQYLLMGGGHDIWDNSDDFHYAYNRVSGDVRVSASFEWILSSNDWAKAGVMLRNTTDGGSVHRLMTGRGLEDYAGMQGRVSAGGGSSEIGDLWTGGAQAFAIQRVTIEGLTVIEGLADFGNGWESRAVQLVLGGFDDDILAGVAITSHDDSHLVQARCWNVEYELNPSLVGELSLPTVPADADLGAPTSDISGFSIRSLKPLVSDGWGYDAMNELLDTGTWMGLPAQPGTEGTRIDEFVNLRDTGNGAFSEANGYPDAAFPGIDPDEVPAQDPAAGDDDDNFATEILGCIQLTAGIHQIGASSDDGTILEIGGVEIIRTGEWKGASNEDFLYQVEADGWYNLRARTLEGGGGASIELHEIFMDGTRILLNDVANGGSAVFAPAP